MRYRVEVSNTRTSLLMPFCQLNYSEPFTAAAQIRRELKTTSEYAYDRMAQVHATPKD